jgi:hypothetical protein
MKEVTLKPMVLGYRLLGKIDGQSLLYWVAFVFGCS